MAGARQQQQQGVVTMEGIRHIGDGLLEVGEDRLKEFLAEGDINDLYDVEQTPFARGKFAAVRRAVHKKTGVNFAAKFLRRRRRAQSSDKDIGHEVAVLLLCSDSKHIVKLHSVHESATETALLLELATGGELQAILDDEGELSEPQTQICMREILQALRYLHSKSIAHLDIKPQNILMCGEKVEDGLKLCDFGISRVVEEGGKIREILGTADYVAPEVLQYEPLCLKTDIWSIGVLAYVLLTGCSPFAGDTKQETFLNISQCDLTFPDELFEGVSVVAIEFIRSALRIKPQDRMSVEECLAHKWLADESPIRPLSIEPANGEEEETVELVNSKNGGGAMEQVEEEKCLAVEKTQEDEIKLEASLRSDEEDDDDQSEECASNSDKENSLVYNTVNNHNNMSCSSSSSNSSHSSSSSEGLFPDAPTTPKVLRKAPSETSPSVKALVKKFQVDSVKQQMSNAATTGATTTEVTSAATTPLSPSSNQQQQSACFVSLIPKLVNSPKSTYIGNSLNKYSPSGVVGSPPKHVSSLGLMALRPKGLNLESRLSCTSEKSPIRKKSASPIGTTGDPGSPTGATSSSATEQQTKSPSARYNPIMACVICGEFVCRHQTTNNVPRKSIGMEQRITC